MEYLSCKLYNKIRRLINLRIKFANKGTTLIVSILGELDHHSAEYARQKIDNEIMKSTTKNIVFDFSKLSFMDSSGIGVIMGRYKNVRELNGKTAIVNSDSRIKRIVEMAGILKIMPMYGSINEAIQNMQ